MTAGARARGARGLLLSGLALVAAACGGRGGPVSPQDRGRVRIVKCRAAPALPTLGAEGTVFGSLTGIETGEIYGALVGGGVTGIGTIGIGRVRTGSGLAPVAAAKPATAVALGAPSVTGALAPEAIRRVLAARVPQLAACAPESSRLLASGEAMARAVVTWRFTVGPTGRVIQADATSQVLSAPIAACVSSVVRGAQFPAPSDGRVVAVALPIAFDGTGVAPEAPSAEEAPPWTPYAQDAAEGASVSAQVARAAEGALRGKLAALDACFAVSTATGSLRAMLAVGADGELISARAGGLGDRATEACVENAVTGLRVMLPSEQSSEIACDLSRGDAQPWRVTLDRPGYGVVEVSKTRVRSGSEMLSAGEEVIPLSGDALYLLVADADAPGAMLALAMRWTREAGAALIAVRAPGAGGAQLVGAGLTAATESESSDEPVRATIQVGATTATACASMWKQEAKLSDAVAVASAAQQLAAKCRALACTQTLVLAVDRDAVAKELPAVVSAARRAGFDRVLVVRGRGGAAPAGEGGEGGEGGGSDSEDGSSSGGCTMPTLDAEP